MPELSYSTIFGQYSMDRYQMIWNVKGPDLKYCNSLRNYPLKYPSIMWDNLLVIIFLNLDFVETVPLVKFLCVVVGNLDVKVYLVDFGLYMCRGSGEDKLQTLRPQFP